MSIGDCVCVFMTRKTKSLKTVNIEHTIGKHKCGFCIEQSKDSIVRVKN